uniref:Uncharacterized protein n=1 Tax=Arundo donax TaxID=35708 RepID=A0A0A8Y058_ARUDO
MSVLGIYPYYVREKPRIPCFINQQFCCFLFPLWKLC